MLCYRTSADVFKAMFDLLVSVTLFVGRFDMRMMQVQLFIYFSQLFLESFSFANVEMFYCVT